MALSKRQLQIQLNSGSEPVMLTSPSSVSRKYFHSVSLQNVLCTLCYQKTFVNVNTVILS